MTTSISGSLATTSTTTSTSSAPIVTSSSHATSKSRGHALMLERLWRIKDPSAPEPKPLSRVTTDMLSGNTYDFLSYSDRKLLEKMYTYAEENNINLEQVDALAFDLAGYRMDVASGTSPAFSLMHPDFPFPPIDRLATSLVNSIRQLDGFHHRPCALEYDGDAMKIMIFLHGTAIMHRTALGCSRRTSPASYSERRIYL